MSTQTAASQSEAKASLPAACGDHHGRQRPLGQAAASCRGSRATARGGIRAHYHSHRGRVGHQISHSLRVLGGELEPAQGRGGCTDEYLVHYLKTEIAGAQQKQRRLEVIGQIYRLPEFVQDI